MTEQKLTPLEFAKRYAEKSKVSLQSLADKGFVVASCDEDCKHPTCQGWVMETTNYIDNCIQGDISLPDEVYSLKNLMGQSS